MFGVRIASDMEVPLVPGRPTPPASLVRQVNNEVARVQGGGLVQSARLGVLDFVGQVGAAEMPALLREHDVYLSASRADGASLSLLEAMAAGLFPVVTRIRANSAWLEDGVGGFLHRPGDPEDLASRLLALIERPELAASAAALNRRRVVAGGDRATNLGRLQGIYEELVASGGRR